MIIFHICAFILITYVTQLSATESSNVDDDFYSWPGDDLSRFEDGIPGVDYPNHTQIPDGIIFSCYRRTPGFYANPDADCQVYHQCTPDGRSYAFLCGLGTIFNQKTLTCDHWYNYNCDEAEEDYRYNINVYKEVLFDHNDLPKSRSSKSSVD